MVNPTLSRRTPPMLAAGTSCALLLSLCTSAGAVDPAIFMPSKAVTYDRPRIEGYRVDWCESWATNCGKPAADRFCGTTRGSGSKAVKFELEADIGKVTPTRTQVGRQVCAESFCGGFQFITCGPPAPKVSENPIQKEQCHLSGTKTFGVGKKKYARGELVGRALMHRPEAKKESKVDGRLRGCFAGQCGDLAEAGVDGRSSGESRAYLKIAAKEIYSKKLSAQGAKDYGPYILKKELGTSFPIVPGVKVGVKAGFGAGVEFHAAYDIRALPPIADLSGTVKTFANGSGEINATLLGGLGGKAAVEGTLELPSPDVIAELYTRTCGAKADARVELKPWRLAVSATGKVACIPFTNKCVWKGSKVLLSESGGRKIYYLF